MNDLQRIVVVIDSDNTQRSKIGDVLREISTRGRIVVKRAYGNWQKEALKYWETDIKRLAIKAEQQFDYVSNKNATDMALVIDTIELLYTNIYDAFVIVSSDSDYTPLAIKLHESGVYVMGVGEKKTPESFRNACDEFLFLENISADASKAPTEPTPVPVKKAEKNTADDEPAAGGAPAAGGELTFDGKPAADAPAAEGTAAAGGAGDSGGGDPPDGMEEIHTLLRKAYDTYQDDDGYVNVGAAGNYIKRTKPDFDCRTYGHTKLSQLLETFPDKYEMKRYQGKGTVTIVAYKCLGS